MKEVDAVIIGAGFAGLYQLHCLRDQLGLNTVVLEAGTGVGGTWYWNRYPGARCDSESHVYCYSWSEEIIKEWQWSERYPGPDEILAYLNFVADRFNLKKDIKFEQQVTQAAFDNTHRRWTVTTQDGSTHRAQFLITAVGCLSSANVPDIKGLEQFRGDWYHTGQWPHDGVDFTGKRVAQFGTGSSGIQVAPVIAEQAAQLTVYQRTANYSVPARNRPLTASERQSMIDNAAEIRALTRSNTNGHPWLINPQSAFSVSEEQRKQVYEQAWSDGGLKFRATFADLVTNQAANDTAAEFIKEKIKAIVKDPDTAASLSEIDHPYAAKRPPIDTHYFETFNKEHVELIDLRKQGKMTITESGITVGERTIDTDAIVFATGFDAMTGALLKMDIQGTNNCRLADAWAAGPRNYLGLQIDGFPNLFTITGPGSPSVLTNMPVAIEQHVEWITRCIKQLIADGYHQIEARTDAVSAWIEETNAVANATLMPSVRHSWFLGANIPGKPRVFMPYAGGMIRYRKFCEDAANDGYRGFKRS